MPSHFRLLCLITNLFNTHESCVCVESRQFDVTRQPKTLAIILQEQVLPTRLLVAVHVPMDPLPCLTSQSGLRSSFAATLSGTNSDACEAIMHVGKSRGVTSTVFVQRMHREATSIDHQLRIAAGRTMHLSEVSRGRQYNKNMHPFMACN